MHQDDPEDSLRIDLWLWHTRFFKTRSQAAAAIGGGHVRVNGERVKVARKIKQGDKLSILRNQLRFDVTVLSLPASRGPARDAPLWYDEDAESRSQREEKTRLLKEDRQLLPRTDGKPDKRTRRALRQRSRSRDE